MRELTVTVYEAFDGERFQTAEECRAHEASGPVLAKLLANRSVEEVERALSREDPALADGLERAGIAIRNARRRAGELKRPPRGRKREPAHVDEEPVL